MIYNDKNNNEIKAGMKLKHDDGEVQEVLPCGEDDLGFNASNEAFLKAHPEAARQYYPLYQFNLKEWEIVDETKK
ncbi:hypothetical protein D3C74_91740 [compost metagenome]